LVRLANGTVQFWYGIWGRDCEEASSNYRRLLNTVLVLEVGLTSGDLHHAEIYIFNDNMTPEFCFYKGSSTSRPLLELILPLQLLEMTGQLRLFMVHVSGSRMIEQGTDGLSHRDTPARIVGGQQMLSVIPLHLTTFQ
jgi:hypothetical protein